MEEKQAKRLQVGDKIYLTDDPQKFAIVSVVGKYGITIIKLSGEQRTIGWEALLKYTLSK